MVNHSDAAITQAKVRGESIHLAYTGTFSAAIAILVASLLLGNLLATELPLSQVIG